MGCAALQIHLIVVQPDTVGAVAPPVAPSFVGAEQPCVSASGRFRGIVFVAASAREASEASRDGFGEGHHSTSIRRSPCARRFGADAARVVRSIREGAALARRVTIRAGSVDVGRSLPSEATDELAITYWATIDNFSQASYGSHQTFGRTRPRSAQRTGERTGRTQTPSMRRAAAAIRECRASQRRLPRRLSRGLSRGSDDRPARTAAPR